MPKQKFDYTLNYENLDLREHPELYRVGIGQQGALLVQPYKAEILPFWRFRTPEIARESAEKITEMFYEYKENRDFVGMDMARKFLQMGYTRSRRYANHPSGRKYNDQDRDQVPTVDPQNIPKYQDPKNQQHCVKTKTKKVRPQAADAMTNEKTESARIFKEYYEQVRSDSKYIHLKQRHQQTFG